jgi:hypothetical protein
MARASGGQHWSSAGDHEAPPTRRVHCSHWHVRQCRHQLLGCVRCELAAATAPARSRAASAATHQRQPRGILQRKPATGGGDLAETVTDHRVRRTPEFPRRRARAKQHRLRSASAPGGAGGIAPQLLTTLGPPKRRNTSSHAFSPWNIGCCRRVRPSDHCVWPLNTNASLGEPARRPSPRSPRPRAQARLLVRRHRRLAVMHPRAPAA